MQPCQKILVKAIQSPETSHSAMTNALAFKNPSDDLIHILHAISEEKSLGLLSSQAYLSFAHMASKTQNKLLAQHILGKIAMNMHQVEYAIDLAVHVKALANAGEVVPLSILDRLIRSKHISLDSRVVATMALQHRISSDKKETTALIHRILKSDLHEEIRTASVHAQTEREKVLEDRSSVDQFKSHENYEESASVLAAISTYYEQVGVEQTPQDLEYQSEEFYKPELESIKIMGLWGRSRRKSKSSKKKVGGYFSGAMNAFGKTVNKFTKSATKTVKKVTGNVNKAAKKIIKETPKVIKELLIVE